MTTPEDQDRTANELIAAGALWAALGVLHRVEGLGCEPVAPDGVVTTSLWV